MTTTAKVSGGGGKVVVGPQPQPAMVDTAGGAAVSGDARVTDTTASAKVSRSASTVVAVSSKT